MPDESRPAPFLAAITIELLAPHDAVFMQALDTNAAASRLEAGCRRFDIAVSEDGGTVLLFEVYDSPEAFRVHRATRHFADYARITTPRLAHKDVRTYRLLTS